MTTPLLSALDSLRQNRHLTAAETAAAFGVVMRGEAEPQQIADLLLGLKAKGETAEEVAGAATALRAEMRRVMPAGSGPLVDTCGTGGGTVSTFNISTAAALVIAAAGGRVAKHGNRSYTSKCGSADVLEALGVVITHEAEPAARQLDEVGMTFLFAPTYHPAMRHVGPTRKQLGIATIMNLLGPLANPAGVRRQVIGVADAARGPLLAEALGRLGVDHALVVHGELGMDEISPVGRTLVWEITGDGVEHWTLDPAGMGHPTVAVEALQGSGPAENAARIERLVGGGTDDAAGRLAVSLNAGAGLYVAGLAATLAEGVRLAEQTLAEGRGREVLSKLQQEI